MGAGVRKVFVVEKIITNTKGESFKVYIDDSDEDFFNQHQWVIKKDSHTNYLILKTNEKKYLPYHRLLVEPKEGEEVYHKNGNGLDNRRENLLIGDRLLIVRNRRKAQGIWTSDYKGVTYRPKNKSYLAKINVEGRRVHLGSYTSEIMAAQAYNVAAMRIDPSRYSINDVEEPSELFKLDVLGRLGL